MTARAEAPRDEPRLTGRLAAPISLVVLAAWLGAALLAAAVVAPAAFAVLPTRALAGALVGRVLPAIFVSGALVGTLLAVQGMLRARRGARGRRAVVGAGLVLAAGCAVAQFVITPRIDGIRAAAGVPIDALAPTDERRIAFGRLHGASVLALGVSMLADTVALLIGAAALARRDTDGGARRRR